MVKNKKGGSKHKKMARKNVSNNYDNIKLVKSSNDLEQYACVTKLLGNGMAEVLCNDGKRRLLIIRGKFCGRNRRDNQINLGSLVLVGIREWEVRKKKKLPKVDLLYVYLKNQTNEIKNLKNFNKKILPIEIQEETVDFKLNNSNLINEVIEEKEEEEDNMTISKSNHINPDSLSNKLDFNIDDI